MNDRPQTSMTLLDGILEGNTSDWDRWVAIYGPIIELQIRRKGLSDVDTKDVMQEVLLSVHRGIINFKKENPKHRFLNWLRTIVSRRLVDFFRKQNTGEGIGGTANQEMVQHAAQDDFGLEWDENKLKQQIAMQALQVMKNDFEENTWKSFYLTEVEGKTTKEVCDLLAMKPGTVRQYRARVRKRLMDELGDIIDKGENDGATGKSSNDSV